MKYSGHEKYFNLIKQKEDFKYIVDPNFKIE